MLIDKKIYKNSLCDLWHEVFGDDYSFIELIFKKQYEKSILCFAHIADGKAVSAFYLIENTLKLEGDSYNGYYLYAAATLPGYRKEGLMSELIKEALAYCRAKGIDFVSLVPSEDSLYAYYSRFGFCKGMYRNVSKKSGSLSLVNDKAEKLNLNEILEIRNKYEGNIISFSADSFGYALDCLKDSGFEFIRVSDYSYLLFSQEDDFAEFLSDKDNFDDNLNKCRELVNTVTSPYFLEGYIENDCSAYGMIFPINSSLKREWNFTDIYMNIALD